MPCDASPNDIQMFHGSYEVLELPTHSIQQSPIIEIIRDSIIVNTHQAWADIHTTNWEMR